MYNIDRLYEAVAHRGPVCVGLDTSLDYIPPGEREKAPSAAEAILAYNSAVIEATMDAAACYKVQIAYYEELGLAGLEVYAKTLRFIRERGGIVIADVKRGDIGDTAVHYAQAHFSGDFEADFVTLSPYMGTDTLEPWLAWAKNRGKGAFVLCCTSNKGMRDFEYLELAQGGKRLYHAVADKLAALAETHAGAYGYGAFGLVVGCTGREEAAEMRRRYPGQFFLVPGYGAQGGGAEDAAICLRDGNGAVVNASRSILRAWNAEAQKKGGESMADNAFAADAARRAAILMRNAICDAAHTTYGAAQKKPANH